MSYLVFHHGSYYFQLRVPADLRSRHGPIVRVHLQTQEVAFAKVLALRLASEWFTRFDTDRAASGQIVSASPTDTALEPRTPPDAQLVPSRPIEAVAKLGTLPVATIASSKAPVLIDDELFRMWQRLDPSRAPSTIKDMQAAIRSFRRSCKAPLVALTRLDISQFRDRLLNTEKLARQSVSKRVGMISTLLQVGFDAGILPQNIARGLKIPKSDVPTLIRRGFTADELERLFRLPVYRNARRPVGAGGEACVWMPMIALVTGARLEEIAQLRIEDIMRHPEHGPMLLITDAGEGQRLKTDGSRRFIPLHPDFLATGFLDYADAVREAGHPWLFPALEADHDGRRGANFGKWFLRQVRSPRGLSVSDPRLVFHSFRHGFKTLCRAAGISEDVHDALTGHVSGSVSRRYGEMPFAPLVEAIAKIRLPVKLPQIREGVRHD